MKLKKSQILFIIADLNRKGLLYQPLKEEITDHIYIMVEENMERGMRFMEAYRSSLSRFGNEKDFIDIQQQSIRCTSSNITAMINNYMKIAVRNMRKQKIY